MQAITSLLNIQYNEIVLKLMAELSRDFGVAQGKWPHFSYHLAAHYETDLFPALRDLSKQLAPITISTAGLGIFTGPTFSRK